ncbi:hypothetical protein IJE86_03590 [bacterium]|nr:hypothetical protein [bacterium]
MISFKNFLQQEKPIIGLSSLGLSNGRANVSQQIQPQKVVTNQANDEARLFDSDKSNTQQMPKLNISQQGQNSLDNLFSSNFTIKFNNGKVTG